MKPGLLLHVCCGPCATHAVEALRVEHDLALFFSNSNLSPRSEYERRLHEAERLAAILKVPMAVDEYDHAGWLMQVAGLENEPERGQRCLKCFEFNLSRTARHAREHGFDLFTTTLTVSPHKDAAAIARIGERLGPFLAVDLKKGNGFKRSITLSRLHGLYRQDYCGCEFSARA